MRLDRQQLADALPQADMRVLLMVLYHYTGDAKWLAEPYMPRRDVRLIANEDAGLPPDIQTDIVAAALEVLSGDAPPLAPDPDEAQMLAMMRHCLAEHVPDEYAPMMREQMGFATLGATIAAPPAQPAVPVIIIGAGVAGLVMGKLLDDKGIPYLILEKNANVGGTWWENNYPGCGVDTPNHAYSLSFGKSYRWSRYFSPRDEIQDYLSGKADEFDIRRKIQFNTQVERVDWQADTQSWRIETTNATAEKGERQIWQTPILVSAVGQISVPKMPPIDGMDNFTAPLFHSAHWPQTLNLTGKRVAIVGTGASAMQIAPAIADNVAELRIFQRSPQWARPIPRYHDALSKGAQFLLENVPLYARWFRFSMFWRYGDGLLPFLKKDPDWPHPARAMNRINDRHRQEMTDYIHAKLADRPELIAKCLPDYPPYGKRILLDNHWYDTLLKPHVTLHDEGVARFTQAEIIGDKGTHWQPDIVVMATGFEVTKMASRLNITGRGARLEQVWNGDDPQAYLGIAVPDFPNFFMMAGPTTGLGHGGSGMFIAETQAHYITACISDMLTRGLQQVEAKPQAQADYMARYNALHKELVWMHPNLSTYYRNSKNRVYSVMPWRMVDYWHMTRTPNWDDYLRT